MTYREPNHETLIVQKLRAMEDLLKSFMDRLKELTKKKGVETSIHATITGRIHWYVSAL